MYELSIILGDIEQNICIVWYSRKILSAGMRGQVLLSLSPSPSSPINPLFYNVEEMSNMNKLVWEGVP